MFSPAETCCFSCPLLQGVQIIASYTVVVGVFSLMSMVTKGPAEERAKRHELVELVAFIGMVFHAMAFFAGLKGLVGIILRDPPRLRVLLLYYIGELVVSSLAFIVTATESCDDLARVDNFQNATKQEQHHAPAKLDCTSIRLLVVAHFMLHFALFSYFAFVIWSLISRIETGDASFHRSGLDLDEELAERAMLSDPWLSIATIDPQGTMFQHRMPMAGLSSSMVPRRVASGGIPQPFSGIPRTMEEDGNDAGGTAAQNSDHPGSAAQQQQQQPVRQQPLRGPFQGTAHRLE